MLTPEEQVACGRFRQSERRARFACGRYLLQHALTARLGGTPGEFNVIPGRHRRPELCGDAARQFPEVDFNLSSTPGYVACAVASGLRVGVDIEVPDRVGGRKADNEAVGELVFTPEERAWLAQQTDPHARFYQLWTLKEAIAKADGEGLGLPFDRLRVLPGEDGALAADLSAVGPVGDHWRLFSLEAGVPAALALIAEPGDDPVVDLAPPLPDAAGVERVPVRLLATMP